jgi:uncharacterized phage protein (TIGR01671 family)
MTRKIKFRAWTTRDKCWIVGFCIHNSGLYSDLINAKIEQPQNMAIADAHWQKLKEIDEQKDRIIIMQYTGLKDKKGKEIYEGDIVKNGDFISDAHSWNEWKRQVVYDDQQAMFTGLDGERIEVIGNIYENPELIK